MGSKAHNLTHVGLVEVCKLYDKLHQFQKNYLLSGGKISKL